MHFLARIQSNKTTLTTEKKSKTHIIKTDLFSRALVLARSRLQEAENICAFSTSSVTGPRRSGFSTRGMISL
jgi:hypothetical protein